MDHHVKVELLLNNGAPINAGLEREGGSVLHQSIKAGNVEVVETLLENKVGCFWQSQLRLKFSVSFIAIYFILNQQSLKKLLIAIFS